MTQSSARLVPSPSRLPARRLSARRLSARWLSVLAPAVVLLPALLGGCQSPQPDRRAQLFDTTRGGSAAVPVAFRTAGPVDLMLPASSGVLLPARRWPADASLAGVAPRAVVLALHGFGDSRDGWELAGPAFAAAGITLYAPDQRGFGAAPHRGTWPGTATLLADDRAMIAAIAAMHPGVPLYVMGESMGGAEAQILAADPPPGVAGFIALAPAVWSASQMGPGLTVPLALANAFVPDWQPDPHRFGVRRAISDNCTALLRLSYDPLTLPDARIGTVHGLVGLMTEASAAAPRVRAPLLIAYGAHDQLVPAASMRADFAALPAGVRKAYYPNGYHLLPDDLGRQLVFDDVISWISTPQQSLPSGADIFVSTFPNVSAANDAHAPIWGRLDDLVDVGHRGAHHAACQYDPEAAAQDYPQLVGPPHPPSAQ